MPSFVISVIVFVVLVAGLVLWQRWTRRASKPSSARIDEQIHLAAEVAQRRHVQRFGRASTDIQTTLNGHASAPLKP